MSPRPVLRVLVMVAAGFAGSALYQLIVPPSAIAANAPPANEVRATRFVLVDDAGRVLAEFGKFVPALPSADKASPAVKEMTGVIVYGADGKPDVQLGSGGPVSRLTLRSEVGWMVAGPQDKGCGLGIWVPEETLRFGLGMRQDGNAGLLIRDLNGKDRLTLGMPPHAGISMALKGDDGQPVWSAP